MATKDFALEEAKRGEKSRDVGQLSQWYLMRRRFMQSKLSVFGGIVLIIMYAIAILSPFLSPNQYDQNDSDYGWSAPTLPKFVDGQLGLCGVTQTLNQATFAWEYAEDCSTVYPIRFFIHSYKYDLLGIQSDVHLFGVETPVVTDPTAPKPPKLYLFGADSLGRDVFSRVLEGSRVSMSIGLVGVAISVLIGSVLGTASGYFGGAVDNLLQRFVELIQSMPTLPLWAALAAALPSTTSVVQRYFLITIVISLVSWTGLSRQVRAKVLSYRTLDYTNASRLAGASDIRIILSHMMPNALSHIIVVATLAVPATIIAETSLSFLGLGMLPPAVSWGVLLRDAQQLDAVLLHLWLLIPGLAVILAVTCFQFLGDGMRDAADPYS
jgi:peptide/nickel transport system permease protein